MAAAIMNHNLTAGQAVTGSTVTPMAGAASGTSGTSGNSATISANDFLTLLVTEMKNQDPTATTDPNEYINQLVNVNSLQQLISINETLTAGLGSPTPTGHTSGTAVSAAQTPGTSAQTQTVSSGATTSIPDAIKTAAAKLAPGNLSIPTANPAAQNIAQSLSGRLRVK